MTARLLYGVYGASGHGRESMPLARMALEARASELELVFIDDDPPAAVVNGHRVLTYEKFRTAEATAKYVNIAIANSRIREKLADRCVADGLAFFPIVASNVVTLDGVDIGAGHILSPFVALTCNITIGIHFHANIYASVAHDCVIGDYVTFGPSVTCNGNTVVEDHAYLGTGAILRHGKPGEPLVIGRGAIVGMGAVVTKSVPPGATVVGNPARPLAKS